MLAANPGMYPVGKHIEISQGIERHVVLLSQRPHTSEMVTDQSSEVRVASQRGLHMHVGCRQTNFLKDTVQGGPYFRVYTGAQKHFVDRERKFEPERTPRGGREKRNPGRLLKGNDAPARTNRVKDRNTEAGSGRKTSK